MKGYPAWMAAGLASFELVLLCFLTLTLAVLDTPVPRPWAWAAGALVVVQTMAMHAMSVQPFEPAVRHSGLVHSLAEGIAVLAVPALTAALLGVVFFHCARAYAHARARLDRALGRARPY